MIVVYTTIMRQTCKISFLARCDFAASRQRGFGPALLTESPALARLIEQRPQSRQFNATEAGDHIALSRTPTRQSAHEDRLAFFRQRHFAFAQITARGKPEQPPLGETLHIAGDGGGIAM